MLTLRVDSSLIPGVNAPITLDALLSAVEPVLADSGRIVTALRINGVDEPAFREAGVLSRSLDEHDGVDVETTPIGQMATHALDDALRFLPALSENARELAAGLRGAAISEARQGIGGLAENLALLAALVHTADLWARRAGLASTDWLGEDVAAVERVAQSLEEAAGAGDWSSAADALEHELPEALLAWRECLATGRAEMAALQPVPTA